MQVFVPSTDLDECAQVLDQKRLGKQRVETYQIVLALLDLGPEKDAAGKLTGGFVERPAKGWRNHPAVLAWEKNITGLFLYQEATCREWMRRGYKDTCLEKTRAALLVRHDHGNDASLPSWWGNEPVHASHRAALLSKDLDHYSQFGWTESPVYDYVWPHTILSDDQ